MAAATGQDNQPPRSGIAGTRRQALAEDAFLRGRFPDDCPAYAARTGGFLPAVGRA